MANTSNWIGPVLGAVILIGGYVAYQEWRENDQHEKQCAAMKRLFMSNMNSLTGPVDSAIAESMKRGDRSPMGEPSIVAGVAGNQVVMNTLDAQCPGWAQKQYKG